MTPCVTRDPTCFSDSRTAQAVQVSGLTVLEITTLAKKNRHKCRLSKLMATSLPLGELRTTSRFAQAHFLAFYFSCISCDEARRAERASQALIII